jgi:peptide/nickel transport system ATP-binding protein
MSTDRVSTRGLTRLFPVRSGLTASVLRSRTSYVHAVENVNLSVPAASIVGAVGESGCGKTTTGRLMTLLDRPTQGEILFEGVPVAAWRGERLKHFRRKVQMIFQDPYESLDPRQPVFDTLAEPLRVQRLLKNPAEYAEEVQDAMEFVGLTPTRLYFGRYPHEMSGGQRQRVAIARALVLKPSFVVADEPVSMLDVSIRVGILDLMLKWRDEIAASFLFITHDIALARYMCDSIVVMYMGQIVEAGPTDSVVSSALHPYTRELMRAVPVPDPTFRRPRSGLKGGAPNLVDPGPECRFTPRCPETQPRCRHESPPEYQVDPQHRVRCFLYDDYPLTKGD